MIEDRAGEVRRWARRSLGVVAGLLLVGLAASCWVQNTKILLRDDYERGYDLGKSVNKGDPYPFCLKAAAQKFGHGWSNDWEDWDEAAIAFAIGCTDGVEGYERQASRLDHKWDSFISDGSGGEEYSPYALG